MKKTSVPFGGLDVIVVGDFAQLPAVKQTPLIQSMVRSTLLHTPPTELTLKTTALMSMFVQFDSEEFKRSDSCTELSSLLGVLGILSKDVALLLLRILNVLGF